MAVPQRGAVFQLEQGAHEGTITLDAVLAHHDGGVHGGHERTRIAGLLGLFQAPQGLLVLLLGDSLLLVGKNLGVDEARTREALHGIGQLRELHCVAEIAHQLEVVAVTQALAIGIACEIQGAGAQQHTRFDAGMLRRGKTAQVARVGEPFEIDAAVVLARVGALGHLDVIGQLVAPIVLYHMRPSLTVARAVGAAAFKPFPLLCHAAAAPTHVVQILTRIQHSAPPC